MDACKEKFRKAFEEQEKAEATYKKANEDGSVTRNEVIFLAIYKWENMSWKTSFSLLAGEQAPDAGLQDEPGVRRRQGEVRLPAGQDQRVPEQVLPRAAAEGAGGAGGGGEGEGGDDAGGVPAMRRQGEGGEEEAQLVFTDIKL